MAVAALTRKAELPRARGRTAATPRIEATDVQGLVLRGYGKLPECRYLLLSIQDGRRARSWLRELLPHIAPGQPAAEGVALSLAFTHPGLLKLGLSEAVASGFSREFREGMVSEHRSRLLGDVGENAPECWQWGGPKTPTVHILLAAYADTPQRLAGALEQVYAGLLTSGLSQVSQLVATSLRELNGAEHFGFADGVSQPAIEGYHEAPSELHRVKAGEFLLGYPNEYGQYTERPLLAAPLDPRARLGLDREGSPFHDLGRNGTYLVFRQLRQNVPAFRRALEQQARDAGGDGDRELVARLAAKMVGRWPSGASLVLAPDGDAPEQARNNEFRYHHEDREGLRCPLGAHVRRANPRDALDPQPGTSHSLDVNHRHRLLRRGRAYGKPLPEGQEDSADRGIFFIALNANISRQFEFVQHSWLLDPHFNGLYAEADPIAGATRDNQFVVPGTPVPVRYTGLPSFVIVAGGAYFFLPSLRALSFLAELSS